MGQTEDAKGKWQKALEKEGEVPLSETTSESRTNHTTQWNQT